MLVWPVNWNVKDPRAELQNIRALVTFSRPCLHCFPNGLLTVFNCLILGNWSPFNRAKENQNISLWHSDHFPWSTEINVFISALSSYYPKFSLCPVLFLMMRIEDVEKVLFLASKVVQPQTPFYSCWPNDMVGHNCYLKLFIHFYFYPFSLNLACMAQVLAK